MLALVTTLYIRTEHVCGCIILNPTICRSWVAAHARGYFVWRYPRDRRYPSIIPRAA